MAMVRCNRHGLQGMDLVCSHIAAMVDERKNIGKIISLNFVSDENTEDPFDNMESEVFYCPKCVEQYGFPPEDSEMPESEYENVVGKEFRGVCVKCFKEVREMT